jgi:hypothetical protein
MSHTVDSYEMLGLEKPAAATQAMRFIQGLDGSHYATMQTSFAKELDTVGDFLGLCRAHVHRSAIANILSFSQLQQLGISIVYSEGDDPNDDGFTIIHNSGNLKSTHRANGLYVHDTRARADNTCLVTTVADNEALYWRREVTLAREACQLQRRMANPPDAKLIKAIASGTLQNTTVTPSDVTRATAIYGPSIEAIKGRTTATRALPFPQEESPRMTAEQKM